MDGLTHTTGPKREPKIDPAIQPDWRWLTAVQRFQAGLVSGSDDSWIKNVEALLWLLQPQVGLKELPPQFHPVATAIQIYNQDSLRRDILEAVILAQQTDEEISVKCGIPANAVAAYAAIFWDVRGPERDRVWMAAQFCGSTLARDFKASPADALKLRAFFRGSQALEEMIDSLYKMDGPTIAACTPEDCPEDELILRYELGVSLLRRSREKLLRRIFIQDNFMLCREFSIQPADAWSVLRRAKLSQKLRKEIRQLAKRQLETNRMDQDPVGGLE